MAQSFRTLKGYGILNHRQITYAMEDYLEMICRYTQQEGYIRVNQLASRLHVKPSSCSKMVSHLKDQDLVSYEKYGMIRPTQKGQALGEYLLYRHDVLNRFFCFVNGTSDELEQTEKIEHFMDEHTVKNIERLLANLSV